MAENNGGRGANGEFHFILREKRDRNGDVYLFGGLPLLNSVLFIRPDFTPPGESKRWKAVLKPYTPPKGEGGTDSKDSSETDAIEKW